MVSPSPSLDREFIRHLPKVHLHDHLDGGLRPTTILELASEHGIALPAAEPRELAAWFHRGAQRGSLPLYLEGFAVTTSVMQTKDALRRVARERAQDLGRDGVVYSEVRFAPILHLQRGLNLEEVVSAVLEGLEEGSRESGMVCRLIICAMRNMDSTVSLEMAELAVDFRDRGVVGFDIAGDEFGHPPKRHIEAFQYLRQQNFNITIHAGEAFGLGSIWQAIQVCGAHRVGHATRLYEDMQVRSDGTRALGTLAQYVLDKRIPLEMCLSSNVHTGAAPSFAEHPFPHYFRLGFRVVLNTDNDLMSGTNLTEEWWLAHHHYGLGVADLRVLAINGARSAFLSYTERRRILHERILPRFDELLRKG
ncbi:MAG: adenosine deaminase [Planctomycetota bacterium]